LLVKFPLNPHEIPWNPIVPLPNFPFGDTSCFLSWGAEDNLTLANLWPRSRRCLRSFGGSMWMWQSRSVATNLKDLVTKTCRVILSYTLQDTP
jgi:hypothetical protein